MDPEGFGLQCQYVAEVGGQGHNAHVGDTAQSATVRRCQGLGSPNLRVDRSSLCVVAPGRAQGAREGYPQQQGQERPSPFASSPIEPQGSVSRRGRRSRCYHVGGGGCRIPDAQSEILLHAVNEVFQRIFPQEFFVCPNQQSNFEFSKW